MIIVVHKEAHNQRIDKFLSEQFPNLTRSYIQKNIKNGCVLANDKVCKASYKVQEADKIQFEIPEPETLDVIPQDIPLDILYEDQDVLIVNKPKGMVVHPAPGHPDQTLVNAVLFHCKDSLSGINGVIRPGIVHRIDQDTTGSLIICKNDKAHVDIAQQIKDHSVNRIYRGIVIGNVIKDEGTIVGAIGRDRRDRKKMTIDNENGKPATTHYRVLQRFSGYTYMEFKLETGRTHQIRVHMSSIGHPLLGDEIYGPQQKRPKFHLQGQTLHAMTIGFIHPTTKEYMEFEAPLPEYFVHLLEIL